MKRRLLLSSSLLLILTACSNEEGAQIVIQTDDIDQVKKEEPKETKETISIELEQSTKDIYAAYYSTLLKLIKENGFVNENHELGSKINNQGNGGVLYAELLDFNVDGIEEFLVIYVPIYSSETLPIYTLRVYSYIDGENVVLHEEEFDEGGQAEQTTISLIEDDDGNILIKHDDMGQVQEENIKSFQVYSLNGEGFTHTKYFGNDELNSYSINDKTVDADVFLKESQKYKNERYIVNSNGSKFFENDISNPAQLLNNVIKKLKTNQNSVVDKPNEISNINNSDLLAMKEILEKVWYVTDLNLENKVEIIQNAYGYSLLDGMDFTEYEEGYYAVIDEENLNEQLYRYFNTTISSNQVDKGPNENNENGNVFYKDGKYYILDAAFSLTGEFPIREVEKVVAIDDDTYYVDFRNYTFETYEYQGDIQQLKHLPLDEWPDSARMYVKEGYFGHIPNGTSILKKNNDGTFAVCYLSETEILTDAEIQRIQN